MSIYFQDNIVEYDDDDDDDDEGKELVEIKGKIFQTIYVELMSLKFQFNANLRKWSELAAVR